MSEASSIIDTVIESLNAKYASVYKDEPIIKRAGRKDAELPEFYKPLKEISSSPEGIMMTESRLFYTQAKAAENFEDSFPCGATFSCFYPTYKKMSERQLRAYFTWRSEVRRGIVKETSVSFAFVYIYELLHTVGASSPEDAYLKLRDFFEEYGKIDPIVLRYRKNWLRDMKIYYGIGKNEHIEASEEEIFADAASTLASPDLSDDASLFKAICTFSSFNIEKSKLYKSASEDVEKIFCLIYRKMFDFCRKNRKIPLDKRLFGEKITSPYTVFSYAVFYDVRKYKDYEYRLSPSCVYRCRNRSWSVEKYRNANARSRELGAMMKCADAMLRPHFNIDGGENASGTNILKKIIGEALVEYTENKKREEASKIEFDFSKLDFIRDSAEITCEKLITEDERCFSDEEYLPFQEECAEKDTKSAADEKEENAPLGDTSNKASVNTKEDCEVCAEEILTETEKALLRVMTDGGNASDFARKNRFMLSVAIDEINEKLFDIFGDTAVVFDGDTPQIIEDYLEELKGMVNS